MIIEYKGILISKNSYAFELYELKKFKELDIHLKQLDEKMKRLEALCTQSEMSQDSTMP